MEGRRSLAEVSELLSIIGKYVCYITNIDLNPFDLNKQFSYYLSIHKTFCNIRGSLIYYYGVALQFSAGPGYFLKNYMHTQQQSYPFSHKYLDVGASKGRMY